ncbi:MAG: alpha/beta fold hydrolase, partial [Actinomycetota bacterium]
MPSRTTAHPALAIRIFGSGRPVAALHGFTLTGKQFASLAGSDLQIHAADLPGHGRTRVDPIDLSTTVTAVAEWLASFDQPVPLMGYSQGGRIALLTALEYPDLVERLVLVSTSLGIEDENERRIRRVSDETLADRIEEIGIERFLDEWISGPFTATGHLDEATRQTDRDVRMENTAAGLATALRGLGQGSQPYVGDQLAELGVPLLTISGERDAKYASLAAATASGAPDGRHVSIEDAGHNV